MSDTHPRWTVVEPASRWPSFALSELWAQRELVYFLAWRDVKVRYKQTLLGVAWAILQPLATMVVFSLFFGRLAKVPSDGVPYPLFALAALVPWTFFANGLTQSAEQPGAQSEPRHEGVLPAARHSRWPPCWRVRSTSRSRSRCCSCS